MRFLFNAVIGRAVYLRRVAAIAPNLRCVPLFLRLIDLSLAESRLMMLPVRRMQLSLSDEHLMIAPAAEDCFDGRFDKGSLHERSIVSSARHMSFISIRRFSSLRSADGAPFLRSCHSVIGTSPMLAAVAR